RRHFLQECSHLFRRCLTTSHCGEPLREPAAGRIHLPGSHGVHEQDLASVRCTSICRRHRLPTARNRKIMTAAPKTILVVDDAALARTYYRSILEGAGFRVEEALNGLEALETLLARTIDLLVVDINMPRMDGLTFLRTLRQKEGAMGSIPALVT